MPVIARKDRGWSNIRKTQKEITKKKDFELLIEYINLEGGVQSIFFVEVEKSQDCIFCKIVNRRDTLKKSYEEDSTKLVFQDIEPQRTCACIR